MKPNLLLIVLVNLVLLGCGCIDDGPENMILSEFEKTVLPTNSLDELIYIDH